MGGVLSSGNGLGRGPAERRRGRDWWLRCLSGSLLAVGNDADADSNCDSNCDSDVDPDVNAHAYSDSRCDGNTKADSHTAI
jgi:hypothetical protein